MKKNLKRKKIRKKMKLALVDAFSIFSSILSFVSVDWGLVSVVG